MASVELKGISKRWSETTVVDNLSLSIADTEFLVLLGPSGCGKTTTMRMVAGLETQTEGIITIGGRDVGRLEPGERDVAMVFQNYSLYPQMTVYENIRFPLRARRIARSEHDARVRRAAELVELTDYLDRKPAMLSGGQRQRVALARAIVRSPQVFLMDEPLSNLDARLRVAMRGQIKQLHEQLKTTTIYVTHDQLEAMTLADRVVVMNGGIIEQIGTPAEIYDNPQTVFVAQFVGSPAMNFVKGRIEDGVFRNDALTLSNAVEGSFDRIVLGVRPEAVRLTTDGTGHFSGKIRDVEMIGDAILATVGQRDTEIVARLPRHTAPALGSQVSLALDGQKFWFHEGTGRRIS